MDYYYAKVEETTKIVSGVSQLGASIDHPGMIRIDSYDVTLLGKKYNGKDEQGKPIFVDAPIVPDIIISNINFWDRFTEIEKETLIDSTNKKVKKFLFELKIRSEVDLTDQKLINAINTMESNSIIGIGRADEILEV